MSLLLLLYGNREKKNEMWDFLHGDYIIEVFNLNLIFLYKKTSFVLYELGEYEKMTDRECVLRYYTPLGHHPRERPTDIFIKRKDPFSGKVKVVPQMTSLRDLHR